MGTRRKSGAATTVAKTAGAKLAPAKQAAASGALIEPDLAKASVIDHPAVDTNPRAHSTAEMNQIDFNDPTIPQEEAVKQNLKNA